MASAARPATDFSTVLGRTLRALRLAVGYSQADFAAMIPVERTALTRFEVGRTTIGAPLLLALEQLLLDHHALRRHGDLLWLATRTASRLRDTGALVYVDRPPPDAPRVSDEEIEATASAEVTAWAEALRAEGRPFGEEGVEQDTDPGRFEAARWMQEGEREEVQEDLLISGAVLRTAKAREREVRLRRRRG